MKLSNEPCAGLLSNQSQDALFLQAGASARGALCVAKFHLDSEGRDVVSNTAFVTPPFIKRTRNNGNCLQQNPIALYLLSFLSFGPCNRAWSMKRSPAFKHVKFHGTGARTPRFMSLTGLACG